MIKIKINTHNKKVQIGTEIVTLKARTVKVPTSFEELSIDQVQSIYFILGGIPTIKELNIYKQYLVMATLFGKDSEVVPFIPCESVKSFFDTYDILEVKKGIEVDMFKVGGHRYTMVDLDSLNVKQFNELDHLLVNTHTTLQYVDKIAQVVLRRVEGGIFLNWPTRKACKYGKHYGKKKLTTITNKEFEMIKSSIPSVIYLAIFAKVVEWRIGLYDKYKTLKVEDSDTTEEDTHSFGQVQDNRAQMFGNYHTLQSICDTPTDLFKWEQQNIHDYFTYLCYLKISGDIEKNKNTLSKTRINK